MPAFQDHYKAARQNRQQDQLNLHSSAVSVPNLVSGPAAAAAAAKANSFANTQRPSRIYPREVNNNRHPKSPNLASNTSPLLNALPNSIPFTSFLSGSSPSSGGLPNSVGSANGGVGLGGIAASPPSGPGSYSSGGGGGFSAPRRIGYDNSGGFQQHHHRQSYSLGHNSPSPDVQQRYNSSTQGRHVQPGDGNFACELQTIDELGGMGRMKPGGAGGGDNVVCLGFDGGVEVWKVGKENADLIGGLTGLRGSVKSAKILPNPPLNDPLASKRPLICLVIHSPVPQPPADDPDIDSGPPILLESPYSTSPPRPGSSGSHRAFHNDQCDWRTTVEIWSLTTRSRVATLFTSPVIAITDLGYNVEGPPPVWGGIKIHVSGTRIVVAVGSSGELYVYEMLPDFKCVEKFWTCVQFPSKSYSGDGSDTGLRAPVVGVPVFSLSDRWLAYCPAPSGGFTAGGEIGVPIISNTVHAQSSPNQPAITASAEGDDEPLMDRVKRGVVQGGLSMTKRVADNGYKFVQSYLNGASGQNTPVPSNGYAYQHSNGSMGSLHSYPPSTLPPQQSMDRLVTLVDLKRYSSGPPVNGTTHPPLATFCPSNGVSFLSFSPNGLNLLLVSSNGDVTTIWDLLKSIHPPTTSPSARSPSSSPDPSHTSFLRHVRLIARFSRMTTATVIDIDWSAPRGEKIAVVTERGTVHFYDLPSTALQYPPPKPPPPTSAAINSSQTTSTNIAITNAVNLFNSSTQPLLTAARRRRSRSSSVGSPGGRRNNVLGTSPSDTSSAGRDRITLPTSLNGVQTGCVKFLTAKERGHVAVVGGGLLQIYELRPGGSGKKGSKMGGVSAGRNWEYDLPLLPAKAAGGEDVEEGKAEGCWNLRSHLPRVVGEEVGMGGLGGQGGGGGGGGGDYWNTPLAWAEIETNAAFLPWHQGRRVKMFTYNPPAYSMPSIGSVIQVDEFTPPPVPQPVQAPSWDPPAVASRPESPPVVMETKPVKEKDIPTRESKKQKKKRLAAEAASPSPKPILSPAAELPTPSSSPEPLIAPVKVSATTLPLKRKEVSAAKKVVKEKWVFGDDLGPMERILVGGMGGHGDVEFLDLGGLGEALEGEEGVGLGVEVGV